MTKKETRKNEIIRDSIKVMYLKGYNSTSVNDIAVAAHIPKGSFYNYFQDKEHYAVDAIKFYQKELARDRIALLSQQNLKPLERIKAFFNNGIENLVTNNYKFGCFAGNLAQEMGDISDLISSAINRFYEDMVQLITANLVMAKQNDELTTEIDLNSLASFIISAWQGALMRAKVYRNTTVLDEFITMLDIVILT